MSKLIEHAKREFLKLGYKPIEESEEGPNKWIQENILELLEIFSKQGHSGSSAKFCIDYFSKLANFMPIAPITGEDDEWGDAHRKDTYQNNRCSAVFKDGKNGKPYYIHAIVFQGEERGESFTGKVEDIESFQRIHLPFRPKTFRIDVKRELYDKNKHGENARVISCNDGDYVYSIKDREQLKEVAEYYDTDFVI